MADSLLPLGWTSHLCIRFQNTFTLALYCWGTCYGNYNPSQSVKTSSESVPIVGNARKTSLLIATRCFTFNSYRIVHAPDWLHSLPGLTVFFCVWKATVIRNKVLSSLSFSGVQFRAVNTQTNAVFWLYLCVFINPRKLIQLRMGWLKVYTLFCYNYLQLDYTIDPSLVSYYS